MALTRMALTRYRCFSERQEIELRPLTVVLGCNNSGKSALVRAPYVFRTGIHTTSSAPLEFERIEGEMLESFTDLVYGSRPHGSIEVEFDLQGESGVSTLAATIQNVDEYAIQVVKELELRGPDGRLSLRWSQQDPQAVPGRYSVDVAGDIYDDIPVNFTGLLPQSEMAAESESFGKRAVPVDFADIAGQYRRSYPAVRYFGPFRDRPQRRYLLPSRAPSDVGIAGEHAGGILASDLVRQKGQLAQCINQSIACSLPGWGVEVIERGGTYSVMLVSAADGSVRVNLADTGTGVAQVLPIFLQRAMDTLSPPRRPVLEIVEQPELHLHPAAHGGLADLYVQAMQQTAVRFLIETHSETFLLRLRRRVAEGALDPESLAVFFVEHSRGSAHVRRIHVDDGGNLDYWPSGVFSEDYDETRALAAAQLAREGSDASGSRPGRVLWPRGIERRAEALLLLCRWAP